MKRSGPLRRKKGLRRSNPKRRAKLYREQYGEHGAYVRDHGCVVGHRCGGQIQAAHVKSRGAGGTARDLVGMCALHHGESHAMGIQTFQKFYEIDLAAEAARLWEQDEDTRAE